VAWSKSIGTEPLSTELKQLAEDGEAGIGRLRALSPRLVMMTVVDVRADGIPRYYPMLPFTAWSLHKPRYTVIPAVYTVQHYRIVLLLLLLLLVRYDAVTSLRVFVAYG